MDEHKTPKRARSRKKSRPASPPQTKPTLPKPPFRRRKSP